MFSNTKKNHVLFICPTFFSYEKDIVKEIESQGFDVTWWSDRISHSLFYKVLLRLMPSLGTKISEKKFLKKISEFSVDGVSHIFVVKGEGLSDKVMQALRNKFPNASAGLYLWDGVKNNKNVANIAPLFDSVATFDKNDTEKFSWHYRPLFSRIAAENHEKINSFLYDWCFIGTIHSDRYKIISILRDKYAGQYKPFVFCYFQSQLVLIFRKIFDKNLKGFLEEDGNLKPISKEEIVNYVNNSRAVLDIEHPNQNGLTIRTIETLLSNKKLLTTNANILDSDLYDASRVCVIDRNNPQIDEAFMASTFKDFDDSVKNYYGLKMWVSELLGLQEKMRATAKP